MKFFKAFLLIFLLGVFLVINPLAQAQDSPKPPSSGNEFSTSYDVTYEVGKTGVTSVVQKITLKNLTSQYFVSNFTLTIGSTTVNNISAADQSGPLEISVERKANKTAINVKLSKQIAGIGKTQSFTLKFDSLDFAQSLGRTWEVNLPKIPSSANIEDYNLTLAVPVDFGEPTSISPPPASESQTFDRFFFNFKKSQLEGSGVSVNFGTNQVFDFSLKYHLKNTSLTPLLTSVTLPPDTDYQDVLISQINPPPLNVTLDDDGNYLAWYTLKRSSNLDISVRGAAKLYITSKSKKRTTLSPTQIRNLTKNDQFWEKDNPAIKATLAEILNGQSPKTTKEKIGLIYKYTVDTLKYNSERLGSSDIQRLGAVTALNNPDKAVCMEFTDLFVALARAAGIAARELDGFAYSQNPNLRPLSLSRDLLHAWPEYFDEVDGWVMVDPTWESTSGGVDYFHKFDLNHLVLATKGFSSTIPLTSDDVKIELSKADFLGKPQISIDLKTPLQIWSGLPFSTIIKISNTGSSLQSPSTLTINTNRLINSELKPISLGPIPPFGSTTLKVNFRTRSLLDNFSDRVGINVAGKKFVKEVEVKPFFLFDYFPFVVGGLVLLIAAVYGSILGIHILHKRGTIKTRVS